MELVTAQMTIGGRRVDGQDHFEVLNPATEQPWALVPECTREQLDDAFAAAAAAQPAWAAHEGDRRKALATIADVLAANEDELASLLTREQGKALADSRWEIQGAAVWYRYYAGLDVSWAEPVGTYESPAGTMQATAVRRPLGVVAAITPWNFPLSLAAWKLGPALLAGNTVVLKPSPYTPVATLRLGELLVDRLPVGVVNIVSGGDDLGRWMTAHPVPAKVSFTGSVDSGKSVARAAADDLKRVTLELGGNDPAIVLDDADVAAVAGPLFWAAFANNGQICGAVKRIYVHESKLDTLAEQLAATAAKVAVGDGTDPASILGPINNRAQYERVSELLSDAIDRGGQIRAGGTVRPGAGYFIEPTIITGLPADSRLVIEEQFGPLLPLIAFDDVEDAVAAANDTTYGLGASVWGADAARTHEVASRLDAGSVWVNAHAVLGPNVPFGGAKWSGIGVEGGPDGVYAFTQLSVQHQLA